MAGKAMFHSVIILFTTQLATQIMSNNKMKAFVIIFNNFIMYIIMVVAHFKVKPQGDDMSATLAVIVLSVVNGLVYVFINNRNVASSVFEHFKIFEYQQYKTMFNSLQEGIIVIDTPKELSR